MYGPRFGLLADVQYSDMEDGGTEGRVQRFREAPGKLKSAVEDFGNQFPALDFVLSLGDLINGNNQNPSLTESELETIYHPLEQLQEETSIPIYHVLGNHELRLQRGSILRRLGMPASYYHKGVGRHWTLIVLDTTELSGHHGYDQDEPIAREAADFAATHPLSPEQPHLVSWNGGIGSQQLRWLQEQLQVAQQEGRRVIVAAHHPLLPKAARMTHLAWNWEAVAAELAGCPSVVLVLAGHDHEGGYAFQHGKHWLTLPALLEAPSGSNAYAIVELQKHQIILDGRETGVRSQMLSI